MNMYGGFFIQADALPSLDTTILASLESTFLASLDMVDMNAVMFSKSEMSFMLTRKDFTMYSVH